MKARALPLVFALGLCGGAQAQSIDELKKQLDQALKTIQDLQNRVNALEQQKQAPPPAAAAPSPAAQQPIPRRHRGGRTGGRAAKYGGKRRTRCEQSAPRDSGKVQLDTIYDFKRMNPEWAATERPSQIPVTCPGDPWLRSRTAPPSSASGRAPLRSKDSSRLRLGELKTYPQVLTCSAPAEAILRLCSKAWGELGKWGVGQDYFLFMNVDTFPNVIDYWGPNGMVFVRNPQVRYMQSITDGTKVAFSFEAPNAAIDTGKVSEVDPTLAVEGVDSMAGLRWQVIVWNVTGGTSKQREFCVRSATRLGQLRAAIRPATVTGWGINLNGWFNTIGQGSYHRTARAGPRHRKLYERRRRRYRTERRPSG